MRRSCDACSRVVKRSNDEGVRLETGRVKALSKFIRKVSHVLRRLVISMKDSIKNISFISGLFLATAVWWS